MRSTIIVVLSLLVIPAARAEDPRLAQSRVIVEQFQKELGGKLVSAMTTGGPVQAIDVCSKQAPQIALRISEQSGARVGRTALRLRNPSNTPGSGQLEILKRFERTIASGVNQPPEHFEALADGSARYMKAIMVQKKCLACHGSQIATDVKAAISKHYAADQATGFSEGELRGAFVVEWPQATGEHQ